MKIGDESLDKRWGLDESLFSGWWAAIEVMKQQYRICTKSEEKFETKRAVGEDIVKVQSRNLEGLTFDKDSRNGEKRRVWEKSKTSNRNPRM